MEYVEAPGCWGPWATAQLAQAKSGPVYTDATCVQSNAESLRISIEKMWSFLYGIRYVHVHVILRGVSMLSMYTAQHAGSPTGKCLIDYLCVTMIGTTQ